MKILLVIVVIAALVFSGFLVWSIMGSDVKEPTFVLEKQDGAIELRTYSPMLIAEVSVSGTRMEAANTAFRMLADFIFGNNQPKEKIAMTAPVTQQPGEKIAMTAPVTQQPGEKIAMTAPVTQEQGQPDHWKVRFTMPENYTLATLPRPVNPDIHIFEEPSQRKIVIRFSGRNTEENMNKHLEVLKQYIRSNHLKTTGEPVFAYYNPPWTLPFMRRNEVMMTLAD